MESRVPITWSHLTFLTWTLLLTAVFWAFDPTENIVTGQTLVSWSASSLFGQTGFVTSLGGILVGTLIVVAWLGCGTQLLWVFPRVSGGELPLSSRGALGAGTTSLVVFVLGLLGWYSVWVAWLLIIAGVIGAVLGRLRRPGVSMRLNSDLLSVRLSPWSWLLLLIIAVVLLTALLGAMAPPTARDSLSYHLSVPKAYAKAREFYELPENLMSYPPLGVEMQFLWAMLAGGTDAGGVGERACGFLGMALAILCCLFCWEWARALGRGPFWSLVSVAAIATLPTCWTVATSAYVDLSLALYISLAIYSLSRWWESLSQSWLWRGAIFLGFALSSKFTVLFLVLPAALVLLVRARSLEQQTRRSVLHTGAFALLLVSLVAGPWYLRNWWLSGSPVFPFFVNLWQADVPNWDAERSVLYNSWMLQYGQQPRTLLAYLLTPFRLSVASTMNSYAYYDGVLGIFFLAGLPLIYVFRRRMPGELKVATGLSLAFLITWILSSQQLRYLLPALPCAAVSIGFAAEKWESDKPRAGALLRVSFLIVFFSNLFIILSLFNALSPTAVVFGGEPRDAYLNRHLAYYTLYRSANSGLPAASRIWLVNMRNDTYYLEQPVFSDDFFEHWTLNKLIRESSDAAEIAVEAKRLGITHLMVRYQPLFDPQRSPLIDPVQPRESFRRLTLLKQFLFEHCRLLGHDENYLFLELPENPPVSGPAGK